MILKGKSVKLMEVVGGRWRAMRKYKLKVPHSLWIKGEVREVCELYCQECHAPSYSIVEALRLFTFFVDFDINASIFEAKQTPAAAVLPQRKIKKKKR